MRHTGTFLFLFLLLAGSAYAQRFGGALAIGEDAIFIGETRNQMTPSTVYVYQRDDDGAWQDVAQLTASDGGGTADRFGQSLAVEGGVVLVGAGGADEQRGRVYVWQAEAPGAWAEVTSFTADDLAEGDGFGYAVALHGNLALVGAPYQHNRTGAAYLFQRGTDGVWTQQAKLAATDLEAGDLFGATLALEGDRALIGAMAKNEAAGTVYVFRRDASETWTQATQLTPHTLSAGDRFGSAIGLHDGLLLIGAPRTAGAVGAVYTFRYDAAQHAWAPGTMLVPFTAEANSRFGSAIAMHGDAAWIGAPGDDRSGAAYLFRHDDTGWTSVEKLIGHDLAPRAAFGNALAASGEWAVVGATGMDSGEGAALIFERDGNDAWTERATVVDDGSGYPSITGDAVPCTDEAADAFACSNIDLLAFLSIQDLGGTRGTRVNDLWGWTDPDTGRDYALVGRTDGTAFVDITDALHPIYLGNLAKTEGSHANIWRDVKVYRDHAFIVADGAGEHGMQIFDLTRLRDVTNPPVEFEADAHYDRIHSAHNIVINEDTGYAFAVGTSSGGETCGGGLHMINIQDPKNPTFEGCFGHAGTGRRGTGYVHDAQCVMYHGPDTEYQGKEICFGSNETAMSIADVTDKQNPRPLSMMTYPNVAYAHQGWLTDDHRYFYMNDEGDEPQGLVDGTRTLIWDVADLDDPVLVKEYIAQTRTTDHNLYIKGHLMYQSNYGSGLRILDISNPEAPVEVGFFDTMPYEGSGGSWSNYPYFQSGVIPVTSMNEGLFLVKKKEVDL